MERKVSICVHPSVNTPLSIGANVFFFFFTLNRYINLYETRADVQQLLLYYDFSFRVSARYLNIFAYVYVYIMRVNPSLSPSRVPFYPNVRATLPFSPPSTFSHNFICTQNILIVSWTDRLIQIAYTQWCSRWVCCVHSPSLNEIAKKC